MLHLPRGCKLNKLADTLDRSTVAFVPLSKGQKILDSAFKVAVHAATNVPTEAKCCDKALQQRKVHFKNRKIFEQPFYALAANNRTKDTAISMRLFVVANKEKNQTEINYSVSFLYKVMGPLPRQSTPRLIYRRKEIVFRVVKAGGTVGQILQEIDALSNIPDKKHKNYPSKNYLYVMVSRLRVKLGIDVAKMRSNALSVNDDKNLENSEKEEYKMTTNRKRKSENDLTSKAKRKNKTFLSGKKFNLRDGKKLEQDSCNEESRLLSNIHSIKHSAKVPKCDKVNVHDKNTALPFHSLLNQSKVDLSKNDEENCTMQDNGTESSDYNLDAIGNALMQSPLQDFEKEKSNFAKKKITAPKAMDKNGLQQIQNDLQTKNSTESQNLFAMTVESHQVFKCGHFVVTVTNRREETHKKHSVSIQVEKKDECKRFVLGGNGARQLLHILTTILTK